MLSSWRNETLLSPQMQDIDTASQEAPATAPGGAAAVEAAPDVAQEAPSVAAGGVDALEDTLTKASSTRCHQCQNVNSYSCIALYHHRASCFLEQAYG